MSEVRLTKARTFELDPKKKYIIQVKRDAITKQDIDKLYESLSKMGVKNVVVVALPKDSHLKIVEAQ